MTGIVEVLTVEEHNARVEAARRVRVVEAVLKGDGMHSAGEEFTASLVGRRVGLTHWRRTGEDGRFVDQTPWWPWEVEVTP